MNSKELKKWRNKLKKAQQKMARLLSVSIKAIHSYEQSWRNIPPHVERQMLFFLSKMDGNSTLSRPCWVRKNAILQLCTYHINAQADKNCFLGRNMRR